MLSSQRLSGKQRAIKGFARKSEESGAHCLVCWFLQVLKGILNVLKDSGEFRYSSLDAAEAFSMTGFEPLAFGLLGERKTRLPFLKTPLKGTLHETSQDLQELGLAQDADILDSIF